MSDHARENVERLIALTERLTAHMAADAQAFEARWPYEAASRMDDTQKLANLYRHECARVRQDPSMVATSPPELRARLMRASEAFDAVLARHGRALYAAKTVTEGVVLAIAEEVAAARSAGASYGPRALVQAAPTTAITVNRRA